MSSATAQEGTASNRYTILGRLAGGGMADILLARATSVGGVERHVVLKRVLAERGRDPQFAKMFLDEARLASQLHHPNIAQVYDIGKLAGAYFFTMEYVHGEDVRSLLHRMFALERKLPVQHALMIASGTLAALHHAHEKLAADGTPLGIVHRDVSPANVMVSYEGVVKLLDFGVAKAAQRSAETRSGTIKGKIAYMSPEQAQGAAVDRRSDVFSLGIVLYEMLSGRRLYKRESDFLTMAAIISEPPAPPSSLRSDVSPALDAIVMNALAKDREQRFATAGEMLEAIEALAAREHHALSATAIGRFLRELFGERPEPWVELLALGDQPRALTITSESVSSASIAEGLRPATLTPSLEQVEPIDDAREVFETQLHATPELGRRDGESSGNIPAAASAAPSAVAAPVGSAGYPAPPHPPQAPSPGPAHPPRPQAGTYPPPPSSSYPPPAPPSGPAPWQAYPQYSAETRQPAGQASPTATARPSLGTATPAPPQRSRGLLIAIVAGATIGVAVIVLVAGSSGGDDRAGSTGDGGFIVTHAAAHDATTDDEPEATDATLDEPDDAVALGAPDDAERTASTDAGVPAIATPSDASVAAAVHDAAPVRHDAAPAPRDASPAAPGISIASAVAARDWDTAHELCAKRRANRHARADRVACGLAACNVGDAKAARAFRTASSGAGRSEIERVCEARGIDVQPAAPRRDPCEADPLRCQR